MYGNVLYVLEEAKDTFLTMVINKFNSQQIDSAYFPYGWMGLII